MCQLLVICNEVCNVDVAVVALRQDIFPYLVSVNKSIFQMKVEDKVDELLLNLGA